MTVNPVPFPENARFVSNSEVDTFLTCERKHMFAFTFNKEPKHPSRSLGIGIVGHEILAVYYKGLKDGFSKNEASQEAFRKLSQMMINNEYDSEVLSVVYALIARYVEQDTLPEFGKILSVEEDFYMPINDDFWYSMRLDLLIEMHKGNRRGQVLLIDHKFTYDFFSADDLKLNPQMPKYVPTLRYSGFPVAEAFINQLRTRYKAHLIPQKSDEELFQKSPVKITEPRIESALDQQMLISDRIVQRHRLPVAVQIREAAANLNKMICRNCPFKLPCEQMNEGQDWATVLNSAYKDRTYGYSKEEQS